MIEASTDIIWRVVEAALAFIMGIFGFVIRDHKREIESVRKRISELEVLLPESYLTKEDFQVYTERIYTLLDSINKDVKLLLMNKVDK